jgi:hypothetical protein
MLTQSIFKTYDIVNLSDDPIILTINIGNNQIAETLLTLDGIKIGEGNDSFTSHIGICKELHLKELTIVTTIHDINPDNDKVLMDLLVKGGKKDLFLLVFDSTLPTSGDVANAVVKIFFT